MRWAVLPALLAAASASAEVQVHVVDGRVDLQATAAPLSEVLDRLARQTGMKVTYDGSPQRTPVNLTLTNRTPAEAVLGVLDGLGLNYALRMDLTGTRVETLMISGTAPAAPGGAAASLPSRPAAYRPPEPTAQEDAGLVDDEGSADAEPTDDTDEAEPQQPAGAQPGAAPNGVLTPAGQQPSGPAMPPERTFGPGALGIKPPNYPSPLAPPTPPLLGSQPAPQQQPQTGGDEESTQ